MLQNLLTHYPLDTCIHKKDVKFRLSKCHGQCEQRSCKILQDMGKYFALNISWFVVNPVYVVILPSLW